MKRWDHIYTAIDHCAYSFLSIHVDNSLAYSNISSEVKTTFLESRERRNIAKTLTFHAVHLTLRL